VENQGKFLIVKEKADREIVYNQPAGHWEKNETLIEATIRETLEETAYQFIPQGIVGIYQWTVPGTLKTYLRTCLYGYTSNHFPEQALDDGIIGAQWMSRQELADNPQSLRSPMVLKCIDDYLAGKRYPLSILNSLD